MVVVLPVVNPLDIIGTLPYITDPMKNQYFADRRHLFKYDLLLDVLADVPALDLHLTYVPMLTPDDPRAETPPPARVEGRRRPHLARFLTQGMRNISTLRAFFAVEGVRYRPFRDTEYFLGIVLQLWMYLTPIIYPV